MAPVRGQDGTNVSHKVKWENVRLGQQIGYAIKASFPDELDLFIPHDHEELVEALQKCGSDTVETILAAMRLIAANRDIGICYAGHGISLGMAGEILAREAVDKSTLIIEEYNAAAIEAISNLINEARQKDEKLQKERPD